MDGDLTARLSPDLSAKNGRIRGDTPTTPAALERGERDESELSARRNRLAVRLTIVATIWSLGLVIGALILPVYNTTMPGADGTTFITETVVAGYGAWVLIPVAVPLAATGVVALTLRRLRAGEDPRGGRLAWTAIGLLVALGLVLILSIGGLMIPVAALLARATMLSRGEAAPTARGRGRRGRRG